MSRDENPYAAPLAAPGELTPLQKMPPRADLRFWLRFVVALGVMAIANMAPLYFTWAAYGIDGYEVIGWPFVFRKLGGFEGGYYLYPNYFLGDVLIALGVAYVVASALRGGWRALFHRLQTWGERTPDE